MRKSEDWRTKGGGKPMVRGGKYGRGVKDGEVKRRERAYNEEGDRTRRGREVINEKLSQRETSGQLGEGGETRGEENEHRGEVKKWGVRPATKEVDMPSMFIRGQKHVRGCGLDVSPIRERGGGLDTRMVVHPTPILERGGGLDVHPTPTTRVRGGRLNTRTVVLLLSALLLAASLPQGNSH